MTLWIPGPFFSLLLSHYSTGKGETLSNTLPVKFLSDILPTRLEQTKKQIRKIFTAIHYLAALGSLQYLTGLLLLNFPHTSCQMPSYKLHL